MIARSNLKRQILGSSCSQLTRMTTKNEFIDTLPARQNPESKIARCCIQEAVIQHIQRDESPRTSSPRSRKSLNGANNSIWISKVPARWWETPKRSWYKPRYKATPETKKLLLSHNLQNHRKVKITIENWHRRKAASMNWTTTSTK